MFVDQPMVAHRLEIEQHHRLAAASAEDEFGVADADARIDVRWNLFARRPMPQDLAGGGINLVRILSQMGHPPLLPVSAPAGQNPKRNSIENVENRMAAHMPGGRR